MSNPDNSLTELQEIEEQIRQTKQSMFVLKSKREQHFADNRLLYFQPSAKQQEFILRSDTKMRGVFAGNRFGKSTLGVVEDCSWLLGYRPWIPEGDPLRTLGIPDHGVKGLVIGEDWDKVREIFTEDQLEGDRRGKFFQFLPPWAIAKTRRNQIGVIDTITIVSEVNGRKRESVVYFDTVKSFKHNRQSQESSDWDFIHVDEPIPQDMWVAVSRGLIDRGGSAWWLLTPLREPWMYNTMTTNSTEDNTYWYTMADMDDNPLLTKEAKELFLSQLTEEERLCRQKGIPLAFGNLVYPHYDDTKAVITKTPHGWPSIRKPPYEYATGYAIDPHPQTPHAVLFCTIAPTGQVYWYDEIFEKLKISELAKQIKERLKHVRVCWELCDPIAWIKDPETGMTWADILHQHGLNVQKATKAKTAGIIQTRDKWAGDQPMFVMEHMRNFRNEIKNYFYDKENKPALKDDHMMENMYRTVMHQDLAFTPLPETNEVHIPQTLDSFDIDLSDEIESVQLTI